MKNLVNEMKNGNFFTTPGSRASSRKVKALLVGFALMWGLLFAITSIPATAYAGNLTLYAPKTSTPPTLDGILSPGEWSDAIHYNFYFEPESAHPPDDIDVFLMSDDNTLYIAYDVQPDDTNETNDRGIVLLDLNNDGTQDMRLYAFRDGQRYQTLWNYTDCPSLVWSAAVGFNISPQETGRNHTIIEIKISINQADTYTSSSSITALPFGDSPVGILFAGYGTLFPTWFFGNSTDAPDNCELPPYNATTYGDLYLGSPPEGFPWLVILLVVGLPVIAVVVAFLYYRKKYELT